MENELEQLKRELQELKDWKKSLEASHSIPLNIDQSFRARLGSEAVRVVGTGTPNTTSTQYFAFPVDITTINSSGTVQLSINGVTYEVLLK